MTDSTPRLALPMIVPGQAQKEMTHNEALALLDAAVQASVLALPRDVPPTAPTPGDCWIVGSAPVGDWSGRPDALACWTDGGWRFIRPTPGFRVWVAEAAAEARYLDGEWTLTPPAAAIAAPGGGDVIDVQARAAITAILAVLRVNFLVET